MRTLYATCFAFVTACSGGVELEAPPEAPALQNTPPLEPLRSVSLRALRSHSGESSRALDGDPKTGWSPRAPSTGEALFVILEEPTEATELRLAPCRTGTDVKLMINAITEFSGVEQSVVRLTSDGPVSVSLPERTLGWTLRVLSAKGVACVAEMQLVAHDRQLDLLPPAKVKGRALATSTLAPYDVWSPEYLFDGREETGWVEAAEQLGQGEILTLELREPIGLEAIEIVNGYQRSLRHYGDNARAKKLRLSVDGGPWLDLHVSDTLGFQTLELGERRSGHSLRIALDEGYPGKKWEDLVLSEIRLKGRDGWVSLETPADATRIQARREQIDRALPHPLLDRLWRSACPQEGGAGTLKIRSDSDFSWIEDQGAVLEGLWAAAQGPSGRANLEVYAAWKPPEKGSSRPSGGVLTLQPMATAGESAYHAWKSEAPDRATSCLGPAPQTALRNQRALLVSGPLHDALVPYDPSARR